MFVPGDMGGVASVIGNTNVVGSMGGATMPVNMGGVAGMIGASAAVSVNSGSWGGATLPSETRMCTSVGSTGRIGTGVGSTGGAGTGVGSTGGFGARVGSTGGFGTGVGSTSGIGTGVGSTGGVGTGVGSTGGFGASVGSTGGVGTGVVSGVSGTGVVSGLSGIGSEAVVRSGLDPGISPRSIPGVGAMAGDSVNAVAALSTALLAQQLPPLSKFSGETSSRDTETCREWLEQFQMVAEVCRWDGPTKLVNLVTRLSGQAYAFYKSCTPQERGSYEALAAALTKRFTPVRIQAVQSSLFHDRRQKERETVDSYAQDLRVLFHKAYPRPDQGSAEAESLGKFVLASQFAAGLLHPIKVKVAGTEGDFETLLTRARFEEARLRDLANTQQGQHKSFLGKKPPVQAPDYKSGVVDHKPGSTSAGGLNRSPVRCYGCGALGHYRNKCPSKGKGGPAENPGTTQPAKLGRGRVANLMSEDLKPGGEHGHSAEPESVESLLEQVAATMYSITGESCGTEVELGPVPTAEVMLEGEPVVALLDTGSPVTLVSLEFLLQVLAKRKPCEQTPEEWKQEVRKRLEPTSVALRNYSGGQLPVVRQVKTTLVRSGHEVTATVQVQKEAPTKLLIGTDLLSQLGFLFVKTELEGGDLDLLAECTDPETDEEVEMAEEELAGHPDSERGTEEELESGTVRLLQAARLPGQHGRVVKAKVVGKKGHSLSYFEPHMEFDGVKVQDAVVEEDEDDCIRVLLENHGFSPVVVEEGQILGSMEEVRLCQEESLVDEAVVSAVLPGEFSAERLEQLRDSLKLDPQLTEEQVQQMRDLVLEFADVFALDSTELGSTDLVTHHIDTGDSPPIKQPPRRIPFALRQTVEEMVGTMLQQGVVKPSHSPWSSPVVLVEKKDGTKRFCVDYRRLNAVTKLDVFPLPRIDDTLDLLANSQFFTTLDLASGYWQVGMHPDSQEKTAFTTPTGLYEFTVMPFGLCNSPATFQRLMENVLAGLTQKSCVVYIDDVLVMGSTFEEHLANLREVFSRFRAAGLQLKPVKCSFGGRKVVYLGFVVARDGISPDPQKVEAVRSFPQPHDVKTLRSFLGLASYYRRFIHGFSVVANPLFALTRKEVEFEWSVACEEAFEKLKKLLTEAPVLAFPNFAEGFLLDTDASGLGLGAVLAQKQCDGTVRPVAYASRTLQPHERNYGVTELEALGVVWAVKHFRHYLYGHHCDVFTDHEALKSLLNTPHPSGKLARWGLALQEVDLSISYRPGKQNVLADVLSRAPAEECDSGSQDQVGRLVAAVTEAQERSKSGESSLRSRQCDDPELRQVMEYLEGGKLPDDDKRARELTLSREQYLLLDGVLHFMAKDKTLRIIPPTGDRQQLFQEAHGDAFGGHLREAKIAGVLSKRYWWPGMRRDIRRWCEACLTCASQQVGQTVRPPLTPIPVAGPFDRVGVDVLKFPRSASGNQYAIVFVDYLTKWPEVFATGDQTALTIANLFVREVVCRHGVPSQLLSDRGAAFLSQLMAQVCEVLGVKKVNTTAYHPQTDGLVERFNRTLTNMLAKRVERGGADWDQHLPFVLFAYRSSMQESTLESPFFLLHGRDPRLPSALELDPPSRPGEIPLDSYKEELVSNLSEAWDLARHQVKKAQKAQKKAYDRRSKDVQFGVGERVFVYMPQDKATKAYKFARPFHGPFRVVEVWETGLTVQPVDKPDEKTIRVAFNRVRRCPEPISNDEFWPPRRKSRRGRPKKAQKEQTVSTENDGAPGLWEGRLRRKVGQGRPP